MWQLLAIQIFLQISIFSLDNGRKVVPPLHHDKISFDSGIFRFAKKFSQRRDKKIIFLYNLIIFSLFLPPSLPLPPSPFWFVEVFFLAIPTKERYLFKLFTLDQLRVVQLIFFKKKVFCLKGTGLKMEFNLE